MSWNETVILDDSPYVGEAVVGKTTNFEELSRHLGGRGEVELNGKEGWLTQVGGFEREGWQVELYGTMLEEYTRLRYALSFVLGTTYSFHAWT